MSVALVGHEIAALGSAVLVGIVWWRVSRWQAATIDARSSRASVWVGAALAAGVVVGAQVVPLSYSPIVVFPLLLGLAIAVVTDCMEMCVYDVVTVPLILYALALSFVEGSFASAILGAMLYGGVAFAGLIVFDSVLGLADVYGFAFLGALFGFGGIAEIVLSLVVLGLGIGLYGIVVRRTPARVPLFPGIAASAFVGLTPLVSYCEAYLGRMV